MGRFRSFSLPRFSSSFPPHSSSDSPSSSSSSARERGNPLMVSGPRSVSAPSIAGDAGPAHSRSSSGASSASAPTTPTVSSAGTRSHTRWPSSTSSLVSVPDSPVNVNKSPLHDLVEDPAERDDDALGLGAHGSRDGSDLTHDHDDVMSVVDDDVPSSTAEGPMCICDDYRCEHRQSPPAWSPPSATSAASPALPEWIPGDDASFGPGERLPGERSSKRRRSGEGAAPPPPALASDAGGLTSRFSRRFPSVSKRWKDAKPTTSVSNATARGTPPSRAPSLRLPSLRRSLATHVDPPAAAPPPSHAPPYSPVDPPLDDHAPLTRPRTLSRPRQPMDIDLPEPEPEDPIDRQELSSTPLLPPMMDERRAHSTETLQSPLQSPSVAEPSATTSLVGTPTLTPVVVFGGMPTPPLSSKPSDASFSGARHTATADIPPMAIAETDPWAIKLGHANFHIRPAPYQPETATRHTAQRLLQDWESARRQYMSHAHHVSEHYGPTSQTFQYTQEKWAEIDALWRASHEQTEAAAAASGEGERYQRTLAETPALSHMPSLNDPHQPFKFPKIDDADVVGPMVKYTTRIQRLPSKKPAFLKLFTDPASLLGRPSSWNLRR